MGRTLVTTQGRTLGTTPSEYWNPFGRRGRVRPYRLGQATVASGNACLRTSSRMAPHPGRDADGGPPLRVSQGVPQEGVQREDREVDDPWGAVVDRGGPLNEV